MLGSKATSLAMSSNVGWAPTLARILEYSPSALTMAKVELERRASTLISVVASCVWFGIGALLVRAICSLLLTGSFIYFNMSTARRRTLRLGVAHACPKGYSPRLGRLGLDGEAGAER